MDKIEIRIFSSNMRMKKKRKKEANKKNVKTILEDRNLKLILLNRSTVMFSRLARFFLLSFHSDTTSTGEWNI